MPISKKMKNAKQNNPPVINNTAQHNLEPEPAGLEKLYIEKFIENISDTPQSKVTLCNITEKYASNGWRFPKRLNDWTASVMKSLAEGEKPFTMPRGKVIPMLQIVVFIRKLQKKGYELGQAKKRAEQVFGVGIPAINKAIRQVDVSPNVIDSL